LRIKPHLRKYLPINIEFPEFCQTKPLPFALDLLNLVGFLGLGQDLDGHKPVILPTRMSLPEHQRASDDWRKGIYSISGY
jgi:hypothetical protein